VHAINHDQWALTPFVMIFQAGFLYVGLMSLLQGLVRPQRHMTDPALAAARA